MTEQKICPICGYELEPDKEDLCYCTGSCLLAIWNKFISNIKKRFI